MATTAILYYCMKRRP